MMFKKPASSNHLWIATTTYPGTSTMKNIQAGTTTRIKLSILAESTMRLVVTHYFCIIASSCGEAHSALVVSVVHHSAIPDRTSPFWNGCFKQPEHLSDFGLV